MHCLNSTNKYLLTSFLYGIVMIKQCSYQLIHSQVTQLLQQMGSYL